jgi:predicted DCC family thiol-disulfide oxidoreductase YuxK
MTRNKYKATVLIDSTCNLCRAGSRQILRMVPSGTIRVQDINKPELQAYYKIAPEDARREMHIVTVTGKMYKGAEAVRYVLYLQKTLRPLSYLWKIPGFGSLAQVAYLWVADNRYLFLGKQEQECEDGSCAVPSAKTSEVMKDAEAVIR